MIVAAGQAARGHLCRCSIGALCSKPGARARYFDAASVETLPAQNAVWAAVRAIKHPIHV